MFNSLLKNIFHYRDFIIDSVKRDFQSRYQNSFLGTLWLILQPAAMISVYTLIFSSLIQIRMPSMNHSFAYSIYICSGMLTWGLFTDMLNGLVNVFIKNANIIKKINFPYICLPIIVLVSSLINFLIIFTLFLIFMICLNLFPGWIFFTIFPVFLIQIIFTVGLGIILGVMNVFVRDTEPFISILLNFWFWFTPIVYSVHALPEWMSRIIKFNPMTIIITSYQNILFYHHTPNWITLFPITIVAIVLCVIAWRMFQQHSVDIVDEI